MDHVLNISITDLLHTSASFEQDFPRLTSYAVKTVTTVTHMIKNNNRYTYFCIYPVYPSNMISHRDPQAILNLQGIPKVQSRTLFTQ